MNLYNFLYEKAEQLKCSKRGLALYGFFDDIGLRGGLNRLQHYIHRNNIMTKEQCQKNLSYFENKNNEISELCNLLSDDLSKETLKCMVKYRCSGDYKDLPSNSFGTQYFKNNFFHYYDNECFLDCGAFDGDTIFRFKRLMKKHAKENYKIVAFEPDHNNAVKLKNTFPDVTCIEKGVWKEDCVLKFKADSTMASTVVEDDSENVSSVFVTAIDLCDECKNASFIKMDIEGSEYEALLGAENTIKKNKPKLAICIYHSNEDMLRLIKLIHEFVPEYKLYVRQHTNALCETVLYACI